jgi:hypothetical protein
MRRVLLTCLLTSFGLLQPLRAQKPDSLVIARELRFMKAVCAYGYSSQGTVAEKACRDSTGKQLRAWQYTWSGPRMTAESCTSANPYETYKTVYEYEGNSTRRSKGTTLIEGIAFPVYSTYLYDGQGRMVQEVKKYSNGVKYDSIRYAYTGTRLDTVYRHFGTNGISHREYYTYDASNRLQKIEYWTGGDFSFIADVATMEYQPLKNLIVPTAAYRHARPRKTATVGLSVRPDGRLFAQGKTR